MKPLLLTLTVVLLFSAGAAGMYYLMPVVAPERVLQARQYLDSLDAVLAGDSAAVAHLGTVAASPAPALPDSAATDTAAVSTPAAHAERPAAATPKPHVDASPAVADTRPPAEAGATGAPATDAQAEQARELSGVISKLEDADLRALVSNLDADVIAILYHEASARNKTRLLQAIPPEQAADFVRGLIVPASGQ